MCSGIIPSMIEYEHNSYIADQDIADSVKMEASTSSPGFDSLLKAGVGRVIKLLADSYYDYIPLEALENVKSLPERLIVTNADILREMGQCWSGTESTEKKRVSDGKTFLLGKLMAVKDIESLGYIFERMRDDAKEKWVEVFGSESEARIAAAEERLVKILIHETLHNLHPIRTTLSVGFIECGVEYYTRILANQLDIVNFSTGEDWQANIYQDFVSDYGGGVHKVFFGSQSDPERVGAINEAFTRFSLERLALAAEIGEAAFT